MLEAKPQVLTAQFFTRPTIQVAEELLGKFLVRRHRGKTIVAMITETEAYDGFEDRASHASRGRTARNAPMFGEAGIWYVYLVYGMHEMLNIVTEKNSYPAAVLIRGVSGITGPGRLTKHFNITRAYNNTPASKKSGLWIEDRKVVVPKDSIQRTPRVGVQYAGEEWAAKPWRFALDGKFTSDFEI
ncbi:DNA-3-methyladenine glycosylase [bacterium]|nr:DNA-3-methyladenine glycosylase [bacterium]